MSQQETHETWGPVVPEIPVRPYQTEFATKNLVRTIPGRIKSGARAAAVAPPSSRLVAEYVPKAPAKRLKSTPEDNLGDTLIEKTIGPVPNDGDVEATKKWKNDRAKCQTLRPNQQNDERGSFWPQNPVHP
jgi:hypothetical protein